MQADAIGVRSQEINEALGRGERVRLICPSNEPISFRADIIGLAGGRVLEFEWVDHSGVPRRHVRMSGATEVADRAEVVSVTTIYIDGLPGIAITGGSSVVRVDLKDATLRFDGGVESMPALEEAVLRGNCGLQGAAIGTARVLVRSGCGELRHLDGRIEARGCSGVTMWGEQIRPHILVQGRAEGCEFRDVTLSVAPGAEVTGRGAVVLAECRGATLLGIGGGHIRIQDMEASDKPSEQFTDAVMMDVALSRGSASAVIAALYAVAVFDPAPDTLDALFVDASAVDMSTAERLLELISQKSRRPRSYDEMSRLVLDLRRRNSSRRSWERILLSVMWALGYGRRVRRPLMLWLSAVSAVTVVRVVDAFADASGKLTWTDGPKVREWAELLHVGGDFLLTLVLLPLTTFRPGSEEAALLQVRGGYLLALRVALSLPLLAAVAAGRSLVRIHPKARG